ncbi:AraC family transcriptional regulator [Paenibacillus sp. GD4]|uniref:helix-turn-helix transcriptional regulator n=1 Tax=Paenibacillus sp. GD4 TaxID=3068890 RepID=UPI002796AB16|nr:AraC family transcriptional regulator [Paenibacillus sp. GD4]MDQ1913882.1 AraC family transcriptional regulator [Paenibacillus sp. GD4]
MQEYQQEYADHWYMEPSALQQAGGVWIVRAGRNIAKPHYFVGPKIIELYSLHFVVEGRVKLLYGDHEAVELEAGDLYCLFPHQPYTYYSLSEDRPAVRLHWLAMDGPQLPQILSGIGMTVALPYARGILTAEAQTSLQRVLSQVSHSTKYTFLLQSDLYYLFNKLELSSKNDRRRASNTTLWVQSAKEFIDQHYTEKLQVENLAEMFGLHRSHFTTAFTKITGLSPMQYIHRLRMELGAKLLQTTNLSVTEIALSTGYPELYSFSRAFKRYYGTAPTEYGAKYI